MIESKDDYRYYVEQDRKALGYGKRRGFAGRMRQLLLPDPIRRFERRLRRCEYLLNVKGRGLSYYLTLIAFERLSRKLGFYIPLNVFGPGLSIPHYGTITVNPAARVGKNCRLHACVNIGASNGSHAAPQIGDNVYIRAERRHFRCDHHRRQRDERSQRHGQPELYRKRGRTGRDTDQGYQKRFPGMVGDQPDRPAPSNRPTNQPHANHP
ncbi:hypothetical protein [uncultured Alistipes sp.]|uniref:hypothetical protein n=1 Tax=uncultured Alistipes sp. TaxID=538949 RepID=UPI002595D153|nr:hypothetical protein [uncultured Alistipes sp.]